ncbi:hypothetical protein B0H10DRAFT_1968906 [Mycena sp. CBHHK59/15]|nr:hypothetical protein B0H10DRAFT_1968906 [Mycena sp. CBHHK59/15]
MSRSGATHYDEELKYLFCLFKALPEAIPTGNVHNFLGYVPDPEKFEMTGCIKSVVSHALEVSFGARRTGAGETIQVVFKSRGPALEKVVSVLRDHITGNAGANVLLTLAVTDRELGGRSTGTEHEGGGSFKYRLQSITEIEDLLSKAQRAAPVGIALVQGNLSIGLHQGCRNEYKYNRRRVYSVAKENERGRSGSFPEPNHFK